MTDYYNIDYFRMDFFGACLDRTCVYVCVCVCVGDEEPPAVSSLHCAAPTTCKADLHHNIHQSEGLLAAAST